MATIPPVALPVASFLFAPLATALDAAIDGPADGLRARLNAAITTSIVPPPGVVPVLPQLVLSGALTCTTSTAAGQTIAAIENVPAGSTPAISPDDGRFTIGGSAAAGWKVVKGLSAVSVGSVSVTVSAVNAKSVSSNIAVTAAAVPPPSTPPMRNIASASRVSGFASGSTSNGTDTAHNSVKWQTNDAGVDVSSVAPIYPGWYMVGDAAGVEADITGPLTVTASIEYPVGTRTPVTFAGSASGQVLPGISLVADQCPVFIPAGALFAVHTFITCASGVKWGVINAATPFGGGKQDYAENGVAGTLADKTMTGAPTATNIGLYAHVGVVSPVTTARPVLGAVGDSILNATDGLYDSANNTMWYARGATGRAPVFVSSITGTLAEASAASGKMNRRLDLMQKLGVTHCLITYASNDLAAGRSLAAVQASVTAIAQQLAAVGIKPMGWTVIPRIGTSTDRYQSMAGQTAGTGPFVPGTGSIRHQYNTWMRAKPSPFFDYFEGSDELDVDASGVLTRGGGYWITGDGGNAHLTPRGIGAVTGTPTTTIIPTNVVKGAGFYANGTQGRIRFTSGALAGTVATITAYAADGTVTISAALPSAPAPGDGIALGNNQSSATSDGVHPDIANTTTLGSQYILRDMAASKIGSLT